MNRHHTGGKRKQTHIIILNLRTIMNRRRPGSRNLRTTMNRRRPGNRNLRTTMKRHRPCMGTLRTGDSSTERHTHSRNTPTTMNLRPTSNNGKRKYIHSRNTHATTTLRPTSNKNGKQTHIHGRNIRATTVRHPSGIALTRHCTGNNGKRKRIHNHDLRITVTRHPRGDNSKRKGNRNITIARRDSNKQSHHYPNTVQVTVRAMNTHTVDPIGTIQNVLHGLTMSSSEDRCSKIWSFTAPRQFISCAKTLGLRNLNRAQFPDYWLKVCALGTCATLNEKAKLTYLNCYTKVRPHLGNIRTTLAAKTNVGDSNL